MDDHDVVALSSKCLNDPKLGNLLHVDFDIPKIS